MQLSSEDYCTPYFFQGGRKSDNLATSTHPVFSWLKSPQQVGDRLARSIPHRSSSLWPIRWLLVLMSCHEVKTWCEGVEKVYHLTWTVFWWSWFGVSCLDKDLSWSIPQQLVYPTSIKQVPLQSTNKYHTHLFCVVYQWFCMIRQCCASITSNICVLSCCLHFYSFFWVTFLVLFSIHSIDFGIVWS